MMKNWHHTSPTSGRRSIMQKQFSIILSFVVFVVITSVVAAQSQQQQQQQQQNESKLQQIRELCITRTNPGYVSKLNYIPLNIPPDNASSFHNWFISNADAIATTTESFIMYPIHHHDHNNNNNSLPADAFGERIRAHDIETSDAFLVDLMLHNSTINLVDINFIQGTNINHTLQRVTNDLCSSSSNGGGQEQQQQQQQLVDRSITSADMYISQPRSGSYGWHFNEADSLIYLVSGNKHFRVAGIQPGSKVIIDLLLKPGDAIYIPAGYYHHAIGGDEHSILWSLEISTPPEYIVPYHNNDTNDDEEEEEDSDGGGGGGGGRGRGQGKQDQDWELLKNDSWEGVRVKRQMGIIPSSSSLNSEILIPLRPRTMIDDDEDPESVIRVMCQMRIDPGYVPKLNFSPLDTPPDNVDHWMDWFVQYADGIANQGDSFIMYPNDEDYDDETTTEEDKKNHHLLPDAFGGRVNSYDIEYKESFLADLELPNSTINVGWANHLHGSTINQTLDKVGDLIGRDVDQVDFYISQPQSGSYGWHYNDEDSLLYLATGQKHFRVAGTEVGSKIIIDVILQPGDAIYIPAGVYHHAVGGEELSILWSMAIHTPEEHYVENEDKQAIDWEILHGDSWEGVRVKRQMGIIPPLDDEL